MRLLPAIDVGDVTLVTITGVHIDASQRALQRSMSRLRFKRVLLISSEPASREDPRIEQVRIPPMTLAGYNHFVLRELHHYVDTSHVLIVQADGFVLNPGRWDPTWLDLDYIGAPWPPTLAVDGRQVQLKNQVGNGGFSLRSRRLLKLASEFDPASAPYPFSAEDMYVCNVMYDYLVAEGIRFPTAAGAARFSIENPEASFGQTPKTSFGFHGSTYLSQARRWWQRPIKLPKAKGPDRPGPSRKL